MEKGTKKILIILGVVAALLSVFIVVLSFFKVEEPEVIVYPESNLSDSIFVSQNSEYTGNDSFAQKYACSYIPYTVDTVVSGGAAIDTGTAFSAGNGYYFFYTEIPKDQETAPVVAEQFSHVLKYEASEEDTYYWLLKEDKGFINGFEANYQVIQVVVDGEDDALAAEAYILLYRLTIADTDDWEDTHDFVIAVASTNTITNEILNNCKGLLDADVYTFQYSKTMADDMISTRDRIAREEAEEAERQERLEAEQQSGQNSVGQDGAQAGDAELTEGESNGVIVEEMPNGSTTTKDPLNSSLTKGVLLQKDYASCQITLTWTNGTVEPDLSLSNADGDITIIPDTIANGSAVFTLTNAKKGVYIITINSSEDCGTLTTTVSGN